LHLENDFLPAAQLFAERLLAAEEADFSQRSLGKV
jgi:hypothetical protein